MRRFKMFKVFRTSLLFAFTIIIGSGVFSVNNGVFAEQNSGYTFRKFCMQKAIAAYTQAIKNSQRNCPLNSIAVASCFADVINGSFKNGANSLVVDNNLWVFKITGTCSKNDNCAVFINNKRKNENYSIKLWLDDDGYLTTDNPRYQK